MDLIIHGVYDALTLKTLSQLNVPRIGFDLRGRSLNLVPFHTLKSLIPLCGNQKLYLTFENDKETTIFSFLDLLGADKGRFQLEFRDLQAASFYTSFQHDFCWFFHPEGDWETILMSPHLRAVVLPLKWKSHYQKLDQMWYLIQEKNLETILHVDSLWDLEAYNSKQNLCLSADLGKEVEAGFRRIDQARLSKLPLRRKIHESNAGQ